MVHSFFSELKQMLVELTSSCTQNKKSDLGEYLVISPRYVHEKSKAKKTTIKIITSHNATSGAKDKLEAVQKELPRISRSSQHT